MTEAPPDPESVRCPTCRAEQPWSDTCRRCKCDLRLLREVASAYHRHRASCLARLRQGDPEAAWREARACQTLVASRESTRLMAVAALHSGDWQTATECARQDIVAET